MEVKLPEYLRKQLLVFIDTWNARVEAEIEAYGGDGIKLLDEDEALYFAISRGIDREKASLKEFQAHLRERESLREEAQEPIPSELVEDSRKLTGLRPVDLDEPSEAQ